MIGVYFFPLLGGWLADRFFGKYHTILWLSAWSTARATRCLALFDDNRTGFYTGLFLIALGSGGIKPLVASFVGDQFDQTQQAPREGRVRRLLLDHQLRLVLRVAADADLPARATAPSVAFGIPGVLMFVATVVFWAGRKQLRDACRPRRRTRTRSCAWRATALFAPAPGSGRPGLIVAAIGARARASASFAAHRHRSASCSSLCLALVLLLAFGGIGTWMQLDRARGVHPDEAVDGVRAVLRILIVFALVTPFWSLFDQKASTWVLQADEMTKPEWFQPAQMQALNPALVMILIPFNNLVLYPVAAPARLRADGAAPHDGSASRSPGWRGSSSGVHPARRSTAATPVSIVWQMLPYALLTFGEVLVSATGLEFAYSQAPPSMKGVIMSFWNLAVTVGNLWVLLANASVRNDAVIARIAAHRA